MIAKGGKNWGSHRLGGREVDTRHMYQALIQQSYACVTAAVVAASSLFQEEAEASSREQEDGRLGLAWLGATTSSGDLPKATTTTMGMSLAMALTTRTSSRCSPLFCCALYR